MRKHIHIMKKLSQLDAIKIVQENYTVAGVSINGAKKCRFCEYVRIF